MEECRICYDNDTGEKLLNNVCDCRGSLSVVHESCLRQWIRVKNSIQCDVCKVNYTIQTLPYQYIPRFWNVLGSPLLETATWALYISLNTYFQYQTFFAISRFIQFIYTCLYTWAYSYPMTNWLDNLSYIRYWFYPMIVYNNYIVFPLPTLLIFMWASTVPALLMFTFPYTRIWFIHQIIVATLQRE